MSLTSGARLGPYEILSPIGTGGMGEVYKAKDTRLDRTVAIKVLPEHLAESPERKERFEREATAISQLNHPHICTLYDVGEQDGLDYLVMEYIEGETLADLLKRGALSLDKAVEYGIQIADGLDNAHRAGIIHRDLKPANIIITASGPKILDFGLARFLEHEPDSDASDAPTRAKVLTKEQAIIGTLQYMAPEQLEGRQADARADIFAFGAVLFEMVTGQRAFENTRADSVPRSLDHLIRTCLQKDRERRWQNIGDITRQLEWIGEAGTEQPVTNAPRRPWTLAAALVVGTIIGALLITGIGNRAPERSAERTEFQITLPPGDRVLPGGLALSPDGRTLAYTAIRDAVGQLFVREMDRVGTVLIDGTQNAHLPFFSPDGQWIGFADSTRLVIVSVAGGAPQVVCELPDYFNGGTWGRDDTIIFGTLGSGLLQVSARGGSPETLTVLEESEVLHHSPSFLPDQNTVVFSVLMEDFRTQLVALRLDNGERQPIETGETARFSSAGHLVLARGSSLWAAPFDPRSLDNKGVAVPVLEDVAIAGSRGAGAASGWTQFAVAGNGTLAYIPGGASAFQEEITWMDRAGNRIETFEMPGGASSASLSPDGSRLAVTLYDRGRNTRDIWLYELSSGRVIPFVTGPSDVATPVWSHDGESVFFNSDRTGVGDLFVKSMDSDKEATLLVQSDEMKHVTSSSSDGQFLMYDLHRQTQQDLWVLALNSDGEVEPFLQSEFEEDDGAFSPDGRWVAYSSNRSGRFEVYVHPFRRAGGSTQVSIHGGKQPKWRGDGKELFFIAPDGKLMAAPVDGASSFEVGSPQPLFETGASNPFARGIRWDVDPSGQRFLVAVPETELARTRIHVVLNWSEELERLVPAEN